MTRGSREDAHTTRSVVGGEGSEAHCGASRASAGKMVCPSNINMARAQKRFSQLGILAQIDLRDVTPPLSLYTSRLQSIDITSFFREKTLELCVLNGYIQQNITSYSYAPSSTGDSLASEVLATVQLILLEHFARALPQCKRPTQLHCT